MSLSIGTLVGYLQLDDSNFNRKADAADKKMSALQLELKALGRLHPKIQVDVDVQTAYLEDLKAHLADLKRQAAEGVDVRVETVATLMRLDEVRARIREIKALAVAPAPVEIETAAAKGKLDVLSAKVSLLKAKLESLGTVRGPSLLATAIIGLGPMLFPLAGAATLAFGAFSSGALTAAAGIGVLHLALKNLGPAAQAYTAYQQSLAGAQTSYGTAMSKAGSAHSLSLDNALTAAQARGANTTYAKAKANAAASLAQARSGAQTTLDQSAYGSLSPQARSFVQFDLTKLHPAGKQLEQTAQTAALPGVQAGLTSLLHLAPLANAAISKIGGTVGDMAAKAGEALNKPFWRHWITWLGNAASKDLPVLGSAVGHFLEGTARALKRLSPSGHSLLQWLDDAAKRFDKWTAGAGFATFLDKIRGDAAKVSDLFHTAGPMVSAFVKGFAQAGGAQLTAFTALLTVLAKLPPDVFKMLGQWLPFIVLGVKAWSIAQAALNLVLDANPISLIVIGIAALVAGFIYAYKHSEKFRDIVNGALHAVGDAATWLWQKAIRPAFKFIVDYWLFMVGLLIHGAADAFGWVPGIGPKLKKAAAKFDDFAKSVNNSLSGIKDKNVSVTVGLSGSPALKKLLNEPSSGKLPKYADLSSFQSLFQSGSPTGGGKHHRGVQAPANRSGVYIQNQTVVTQDMRDWKRHTTRQNQMASIGGVG